MVPGVFVAAGLLSHQAVASQEPTGQLRGTVLTEGGSRPIAGALVRHPSGRVVYTNADGAFAFEALPLGATSIAAVTSGCRTAFADAEIRESQTAVVQVVVRAAEQLRDDVASDAALIGLAGEELRSRNFRSVYDALRSIAPYMVRHITGEVGGDRSLSNASTRTFASNEPLVLLDGIRLTNASVAALEDFDVDDLERIDVARGPTAAWRYGLGAANGAVILTSVREPESGRADAVELERCEVTFPGATGN